MLQSITKLIILEVALGSYAIMAYTPINCRNGLRYATMAHFEYLDSLHEVPYIGAMIDASELKKGLKSMRWGRDIHSLERVDSTSTFARSLAEKGADEGTLVVAESQSAGRGRLGRKWISGSGENLTFSIILKPAIPADRLSLLPLAIAVGLARGVNASTNLPVSCKWPNDLLLGTRKFAGILMEGSINGDGLAFVILGIGINVNQTSFPEDFSARATSLALHKGHPIDRISLFRNILEILESDYDRFISTSFASVLPEWLELAPIVGTRITVNHQGSVITGTVIGLSPEGGLQLHSDAGEYTLFAGDVTILDMESYAPRN
jgi:BirA family transcriptional regulator, biotin operon repressor / biotin---[acetyl-CoA-carboxylase] ligase